MTIVNDDIGIGRVIMDDPETPDALPRDFLVIHGAMQEPVTQKTKSEKGIGDPFGEEDSSYTCRYVGKGISHTTDHDVLKDAGPLDKRRLMLFGSQISLAHDLIWQLDRWRQLSA